MTRSFVPLSRWLLFGSIVVGGLAFDLSTKSLIFAQVGPPGSPAKAIIPPVLELRTSYNKGALWGWGKTFPYSSETFAALSIFATGAIVYWLFFRGAASDWRLTLALALITAGALGNCYDRLVHGHVRDFVHFHVDAVNFDFAIFNFADNMLVAGAAILIVLALRPDSPEPVSSASGDSVAAREPLQSTQPNRSHSS